MKVKIPNNPLDMDSLVPQTLRLGMSDGVFLKIEYVYGFEKFNISPHHNYETWAGGWRITDEKNDIVFEEEYFEQAIRRWQKLVREKGE